MGVRTEIANHVSSQGIRSPFFVPYIPILLHLKPESLIAAAELLQAAFRLIDLPDPFLSFPVSPFEGALERL